MILPEDAAALHLLSTEQVRSEFDHLDLLSVDDLVDVMCHETRRVPEALRHARDAIAAAVTAAVTQLEDGGRLIYVGAGTAGRLGMLDAAEAGPTFNVEPGRVVGVLAGGLNAFGLPLEGAEDDEVGGAQAMVDLAVDARDCVVGISASGRTPFVLGALRAARESGAVSIGLACNSDTPLGAACDFPIDIVVGPELIAGSTRMNAGTAQKLVLNIISTASMVRLGKTYGNLMVDLRPTNDKLRNRSLRIVARITGAAEADVMVALDQCSWRPKTAAVMIIGGVDAAQANTLLAQYAGRLRPVLDTLRSVTSRARSTSTWTRLGVGAALIDGQLVSGDVAIAGGDIVAVGLAGAGEGVAVAGYVDNQVNGYAGVDLLTADVDDVLALGEALWRDGVVAYHPTLITSEFSQLRRAAQVIAEARQRGRSGARILGLHLEGPFLSPGRAGTHPLEHLRAPDVRLLEELLTLGDVAMMTLAPELDGALDLIDVCVARGVVVSLGHSAADAVAAQRGFDRGARAVTHFGNAMEAISARSPGLAGVALIRRDVTVQLIADGVHLADDTLRLAFRAAADRCVVVSDAIAATSIDSPVVRLGDVVVHIAGGAARREDGTLAGSIGTLRDAVVRLHSLGIDTLDVLRAVTTRATTLNSTRDLGRLGLGEPANMLLLDEALVARRRVHDGHLIELA